MNKDIRAHRSALSVYQMQAREGLTVQQMRDENRLAQAINSGNRMEVIRIMREIGGGILPMVLNQSD